MAWAVSWHFFLLDIPTASARQCRLLGCVKGSDSWVRPAGLPGAAVSAGVWAAALGKTGPAFHRGLSLCAARWLQFEASTQCWSCIEFLPWNQQNLLQHFAWIKIFVPFFTGQEEDSWSLRRKEIITGPYRSRSCATAAHSLRGRNTGPQTWNTTLSKCLWAAQKKHPPEAYLITMICNRLNVCSRFPPRLHLLPRAARRWNAAQKNLMTGI